MFDQAQRSLWLEDQLWPSLRKHFGPIAHLPAEVLITVGYPSSGARGRSEKIKPAEFNSQWTGNPNEKMFVSIHPVYFTTPRNAAKALLFGAAKRVGARWGVARVGLQKEDNGDITEVDSATTAKLDAVLADVGEPPSGFGIAFPVREVQRARLRKYMCTTRNCTDVYATRHPVIRAASDTLEVVCKTCSSPYIPA
jgi:hypothetical protein